METQKVWINFSINDFRISETEIFYKKKAETGFTPSFSNHYVNANQRHFFLS